MSNNSCRNDNYCTFRNGTGKINLIVRLVIRKEILVERIVEKVATLAKSYVKQFIDLPFFFGISEAISNVF